MKAWIVLLLLVAVGGYLLTRDGGGMLTDLGTGELVSIGVGVLLVLFYMYGLFGEDRTRPMQALRYAIAWLAIGFGLIAAYSYREEVMTVVNRVGEELAPSGQVVSVEPADEGERAVRVRRRLDGHFAVRASVNGQSMPLMVDTGASSVVLKPADAARAGIDLGALSYTVPVNTANGMTYAASARIRSLAIGPLVVHNVEALVAKPGSVNENLLGMSFLRRLRSYEFAKDYLTLRG
ncbi:retropepsin-like aspartic protease family protein [Hyphomicrobium sulfonivorans]|uniref:retropepsin-like aspartic protease family protein n=1 Tax=Hyphomicrobium sulfonivorans TaxID=121290 RepID=UPI00156E79A7|nr:TIGR02281 family clan AA aspartic protease [Hyphomicrobium sulfonivorans]MBI1650600.1 TIGR02281 family clan AA aspartic protease [Hyphomicrobium sulfonivorans]NSL72041.1 TIGR02281 family clan AA aspartic protease [Hyphomicrobium sulfonivorans]